MLQKPINPDDFPIGISDFKKIIKEKCILIDKTLFIKDIIDNKATVILITRPRRFGKTLNMSMLSYFLKMGGEDFFEGLKIKDHPEFCAAHQNKYPIIFLTFKDVKYNDFAAAYSDIKGIFADLYGKNRDLLEGDLLDEPERETFEDIRFGRLDDPSKLGHALRKLTEFMHRKYKVPPIVLLDEYDTPIQEAYMKKYYDEMVSFMRVLLGNALKDNNDLGKAVITGITKVSQESLFSGLNNIKVYTMIEKEYGQYFGFTEEEVISLLPEGIHIEPIREWYNGYKIGQWQIYNPWSIINCLADGGDLRPYWQITSTNDLLLSIVKNAPLEFKETLEQLARNIPQQQIIENGMTFGYLDNNTNAIWTLLLHAGYLNVLSHEYDDLGINAMIAIPNKEVMGVYAQMIKLWFAKEGNSLKSYLKMIQALSMGDVKTFEKEIQGFILMTSSHFDFDKNTPEKVFHAFMMGILMGLRDTYMIDSNKEAGDGRADLLLIPKKEGQQGIILEFKVCKKKADLEKIADIALSQIQDKDYTSKFPQGMPIFCIGMAFFRKHMKAASKVLG
jgi:hypothetical protein